MIVEVFLFLILGCLAGIAMGLIPGIHPNLILLLTPMFLSLQASPLSIVAFVVSMAVVNSIADFIPSMLLGAPDSGSELSVLPGHKMLLKGNGYHAVKLTVIGGFFSMLVCIALLPVIVFFVPASYALLRPFMHTILLAFVTIMILGEKKKLLALCCFLMAGSIGIMIDKLPIDSSLALFPVFTGFFGLSMLVIQLKNKTKIPEQRTEDLPISGKRIGKSVFLGTLGGIFSGLLPGVGSSQIAAFASTDKNDHSFLVSIGAITTANIILSFLALWLISNPRSGVAMVVDQLMQVGANEFLLMVVVSLISCCIGAVATLLIAKKAVIMIEKVNYTLVSLFVIIFLVLLIAFYTGIYGLFLAGLCCSLGIFVNMSGIKRGNLMGMLLVPTILFFIGL